jgi:uncharacterized protein (TIGR03000 family)
MIGRYSLIGSAVTASALLLFVAQSGLAGGGGGHGGGGHGGGGHGGGGHAGGFSHGGSAHAGFSGNPGSFHGSNFHDGNFHDGHFHDGHFHGNNFFLGVGFYPWWGWGGYGWGGGYYGAGWYDYPGYYSNYGNGYYTTASNYYDYQSAPSDNATTSSTAQPLSANAVALRIFVPEDAKIWIQGEATKQQGPVRFFESPELTPGMQYTYDIRAQWTEGGKLLEKTKRVPLHAGDRLTVSFTQTPAPPRPATAPMPRESR